MLVLDVQQFLVINQLNTQILVL